MPEQTTPDHLRYCVDRIAPRDAARSMETHVVRGPESGRGGGGGPTRAVLPDARQLWPNGSSVRVGFLAGDSHQQDMVRQFAPQWTEHANLTFDFVSDPSTAQIRISFDSRDGAWSYLGDRALDEPVNAATMNLGWVDEGVILHEFGHAIGLGHEHQNPQGGIQWNEAEVIRSLSGPPNNWSEAQIRHNVLDRYRVNHHLRATDFDSDSIMLYFFPDSWVVGGNGTSQNEVLSDLDKSFIGSDQGYPGRAVATTDLAVSTVSSVAGELTGPGEEHQYRFRVDEPGQYVVQTSGTTDLVMSLYGPDDDLRKVAEDDDSGPGRNPRIATQLSAGTHLVQLRHFRRTGVGSYEVEVIHRAGT